MCITTFLIRMYDKFIFWFYDWIDDDIYYNKKDDYPICDYPTPAHYRFR